MPPSLEAAAREQARLDALHHAKLAAMTSSLDTRPPPTFKHLSPESGKGAQLAAARQVDIDKGNARLLANLTRIAAGSGSVGGGGGATAGKVKPLQRGEAPPHAPKSMAEKSRKLEQARVDGENARILRNIVATGARKGPHDPTVLAAEHALHLQRRDRISRYPPPH